VQTKKFHLLTKIAPNVGSKEKICKAKKKKQPRKKTPKYFACGVKEKKSGQKEGKSLSTKELVQNFTRDMLGCSPFVGPG